jgi:hypothetical protein
MTERDYKKCDRCAATEHPDSANRVERCRDCGADLCEDCMEKDACRSKTTDAGGEGQAEEGGHDGRNPIR